MAQNFNLPSGVNVVQSTALVTMIPDAIKALQSNFSGSSEPTSPVPYQFWLDDSTTPVLKMRNQANTAWISLGPVDALVLQTMHIALGSVSATITDKILLAMPQKGNIRQVRVVSDTATTGSDASNEWQFMLQNLTDTQNLFSGTVGTSSSTAGVGGGNELAADTPEPYVVDQNGLLDVNDVLAIDITKVGAPTSPLTNLHLFVEYDAIPV